MKAVSIGIFVFGLLVALTSIAGVVLNYSPVPWWDQWYGTVDWFIKSEQNWWSSFWSLHNEHRLLFSRLIFWPDMKWLGGVNILSLVGNVVVCAVLAYALYQTSLFEGENSKQKKLVTAGLSLAFCFSWMQVDNFTWGFQNQWFAVNLFSLMAFYALGKSASKNYDSKWLFYALINCTLASFSMANGSIAWPLLILLATYWRFPFKKIFAIAIVFIVVAACYFWKAASATGSIPHGTFGYVLTNQPIDLIIYASRYLGSPLFFAFGSTALASAAGGLIILLCALWSLAAIKNPKLKNMALLALALFLCATAFATGVGRLVLGLNNVFQPRYATNSLLAWVAILLFIASNTRFKLPVYGAGAIAVVTIAVSQISALNPKLDIMYDRLLAGQALREKVYDHEYLGVLWDHDDYLKTIAENARAKGLTIMAPEAIGFGNPPAHISANSICVGAVDGTVPTKTDGKYRTEGWVYDPASQLVPKTIVITDENDNTIGNGVVGKLREDAAKFAGSTETRLGWVAFYNETKKFNVYALKKDGGYCKVN